MPKSCIPGYDEALETERKLREEIFLGVKTRICGIEVNQITPFLMARLCRMKTPFLTGRVATEAEIVRFLWAISPAFTSELKPRTPWYVKLLGKRRIPVRDGFIVDVAKHLSGRWEEAEDEIDTFMRATFLDAPQGASGDTVPYVTGVAWTLYTMAKEPFHWTREQTLHAPLREIYQLTRCMKLEKGTILYNEISDRVKADWLDELNSKEMKGRN